MTDTARQQIINSVKNFNLPKYDEIPNVGLYLEQTAKYISEYCSPFFKNAITGSMISNYVKKGLVTNPVKKQYNREQIGYLIFITVAKSVISMEDIGLLIKLQQRTYETKVAYDYFSSELKNVLGYVFGIKETIDDIGNDCSQEKVLLRNTIITVAHKLYLEKSFEAMQKTEEEDS